MDQKTTILSNILIYIKKNSLVSLDDGDIIFKIDDDNAGDSSVIAVNLTIDSHHTRL